MRKHYSQYLTVQLGTVPNHRMRNGAFRRMKREAYATLANSQGDHLLTAKRKTRKRFNVLVRAAKRIQRLFSR